MLGTGAIIETLLSPGLLEAPTVCAEKTRQGRHRHRCKQTCLHCCISEYCPPSPTGVILRPCHGQMMFPLSCVGASSRTVGNIQKSVCIGEDSDAAHHKLVPLKFKSENRMRTRTWRKFRFFYESTLRYSWLHWLAAPCLSDFAWRSP